MSRTPIYGSINIIKRLKKRAKQGKINLRPIESYEYNHNAIYRTLESVTNNSQLIYEFIWAARQIIELESELKKNQDKKIINELQNKLKKILENYKLFLEELFRRKILKIEYLLKYIKDYETNNK